MEAATQFTRIPQHSPLCIDGSKSPWHPFTPYSNDVLLKLLRVDTVTGQVVMLIKAPGDCSLGMHDHFGTIHVYTLSGSWYYEEHRKDWIAKAGDFVYEVANSRHTFRTLPGEDMVAFVVFEGALAFLDDQGQCLGMETASTLQQRHIDHCVQHAVPMFDLNSVPVA